MTGSFLAAIIVPVVTVPALAIWIGLVYRADAHPRWKAHGAAPGADVTSTGPAPRAAKPGEHRDGELAPSLPDRKAA
jgi:hypothetical protein